MNLLGGKLWNPSENKKTLIFFEIWIAIFVLQITGLFIGFRKLIFLTKNIPTYKLLNLLPYKDLILTKETLKAIKNIEIKLKT